MGANFMQRQAAAESDKCDMIERTTRQFMFDTGILALWHLGFGHDRIKKFIFKWAEIHNEYYPCLNAKRTDEAGPMRQQIDDALAYISRNHPEAFQPWEERYPYLSKDTYDKPTRNYNHKKKRKK